ncbi:MAG: hypothetical protein WBI79_01540, partial [Kiritimatiellia bacterium]
RGDMGDALFFQVLEIFESLFAQRFGHGCTIAGYSGRTNSILGAGRGGEQNNKKMKKALAFGGGFVSN